MNNNNNIISDPEVLNLESKVQKSFFDRLSNDSIQDVYSLLDIKEIDLLGGLTYPNLPKLNIPLYFKTHGVISIEEALEEGYVNIVKYYI